MKPSYGTDELETAAFVRRKSTAHEPKSLRSPTRVALAAGALVVTLGAALLAIHLTPSTPSLAVESVAGWSESGREIVSQLQSTPSYVVPPVLQTGREILLRMKAKNDLCLDDGGAVNAGQAKLAPWPCNPSNPNQLFVYNVATYQLRSARKPTLCLDAAIGLQLQTCNAATASQRFTYNPATLQLRAAAKGNLCLDDASAKSAGTTRFAMFVCDATSANQRVDIVFRDDAQAEQQRVIDAAQDGATRFQLRVVGGKTTNCLDDGGAAGATARLAACDADSASQLWVWDPDAKRVRSARRAGLCLDDGGALAAGGSARMTLAVCDPVSKHQDLVYDKFQQGLRNPSKSNLCLEDGKSLQLATCDTYVAGQHFAFALVPPPAAVATPEELRGAREFLLRLRDKSDLCLDDGGGTKPGETSPAAWPCNPSNDNQAFVYDATTNQLRSARKANLCLDDGGAIGGMAMATCDPYNVNQRFAYDADAQTFSSALKRGQCLDDGGAEHAGDSQPVLRRCDDDSADQRFEIAYRDDALAEQQRVFDAVASGAKFLLRVLGKPNLCVDDGGTVTSGSSQMGITECAFDEMGQVFMWDATTKRIRSFMKKGLCVDDGGASMSGGAAALTTHMTLTTCDAKSPNQAFVLDQALLVMRNPNKPTLCMDDGGALTAAFATMQLAPCDLYSPNQHVEFLLLPPLPVYDTPPELQTDREFVLKIRGKNALCVDDGGGRSTAVMPWACNPNSENQLFVYDAKANQLRSASKPGKCVDDNGTTRDGAKRVVMTDCDPDNPNQRFVYDDATQMFQNPMRREMCLDDGGAMRGGGSLLTMWTCDDDNPNQHFQIKFRDDWQADQQRTLDAVMLQGARFQIRVVAKKNLCVDDSASTATGGTQLWLASCDAKNPNQVFVWDTAARRIRSASKGTCVEDMNPTTARLRLATCDAAIKNQDFEYDKKLQAIRSTTKTTVCLDDGGAVTPNTARMLTLACDLYSANQRFELVPVS